VVVDHRPHFQEDDNEVSHPATSTHKGGHFLCRCYLLEKISAPGEDFQRLFTRRREEVKGERGKACRRGEAAGHREGTWKGNPVAGIVAGV
jgi:hypothetical protein